MVYAYDFDLDACAVYTDKIIICNNIIIIVLPHDLKDSMHFRFTVSYNIA